MRGKVIAIDYDDVISLDIDAWSKIIALLHSFGVVVYVVTYRHSTQFEDMVLDIPHVKDVIFTGATAKHRYCSDVAGIEVDIWIDDSPSATVRGDRDWVPPV